MTEYWVSQGNKWCDYCKIFISSNAASIRTHELGTRHKENVAKKLAGIRKETATKERERLLATKDLGRIEVEAKKSYERDLAAMQRSSEAGGKEANTRHRGSATGGGTSQAETKDTGGHLSTTAQPSTGKRKPVIQLNKDDRSRSSVPKASSAPRPPVKSSKGVASTLEVGKRKRVEKPGVSASEEAAALTARESARKRMEEREKSLLGLYHG